jgi:hypothetical protein
LKLAGAVIAAIGSVGVALTLLGSIFLWERFDQAGLPAEQALGKVPAGELTIYGAEGLIVAALIAVAAVLVAFFIDNKATVTVGNSALTIGLLAIVGTFVAYEFDLGALWVAGAFLLGLVLGVACLGIAEATDQQFVPFAAALIVATCLFNIYLYFGDTEEHVPVVPAAVVQSNGQSFVGYYVSDGTDNIYLGIPDDPDRAILRQIPKDAGTDLGIGHVIDRAKAKAKFDDILAEVKNHPAVKKPVTSPAVKPATSPAIHTGRRAAALAKCKQLKGNRRGKKGKARAKKRKKCIKKARKLPV